MIAELPESVAKGSSDPIIVAGATLVGGTPFPFLSVVTPLADPGYVDRIASGIPTAAEVNHLGQYLALATSCHAFEGWRYLSQSAAALLSGSRSVALHLAYYAELRAARSILASSGIAIGDKFHFSIDQSGAIRGFGTPPNPTPAVRTGPSILGDLLVGLKNAIKKVPLRIQFRSPAKKENLGTHVAVWRALREWVLTGSQRHMIVEAIEALRFRNVDWVEACRATASRSEVASNWIQNWSYDLRALATDQRARNIASYGVHLDAGSYGSLKKEHLQLVNDAHEACLPTDDGSVDLLDIAFINDFCFKAARATLVPKVKAPNDGRIWKRIRAWLEGPGQMDVADASALVDIIKNARNTAAGRLIDLASPDNKGVEGVFSRALLLLRLATSLVRWQWEKIRQLSPGGIAAWQEALISEFAANAHLIPSPTDSLDLSDLAQDQTDALDNVNDWLNSRTTAGTAFNGFDAWKDIGPELLNLGRLERIAMWETSQ